MSNRVLTGVVAALCSAPVVAQTSAAWASGLENPVVRLGDSAWLLYRPPPREPRFYDLDYMMDRLRCDQAGLGLRFSRSARFTLDLTIAPLADRDDYVGPVYNMDIGAARLVLTFSF